MSHVVQVQTQVRDPIALRLACQRNQLDPPVRGEAKLFSSRASGFLVQLPGWRYKLVCDTDSGQVSFDDYGGRWGDRSHLDALLQSYAAEKCKLEARRQGHSVSEQRLPDGALKLVVNVGGAA